MVSSDQSTSGSTISTAATQAASQATTQQRTDTGQLPNPRYRGRNPRNGVQSAQTNATTRTDTRASTVFKGDTVGMNGHVFQCFEERRDPVQFTKTMDALNSYAKRDLKTTDLGSLFLSPITQPTIEMPAEVGDKATDVELLIQREEVKQYVSRTKDLKGHLAAIHSVAWGQCSEALKAKLKSLNGFKEKFDGHDCVWLFGKIGSVMQKFEETRHAYTSMVVVMNNLSSCRQGPDQIVSDYIDRIRTIAETIEHHGGNIGDIFLSGTPAPDDDGKDAAVTARAAETRRKTSREAYLAALCIQNADRGRFGTLIAHLANQFLLGRNEYPQDLTEAQGFLHNYQTPANATRRVPAAIVTTRPPVVAGNTFTQTQGSANTVVTGTDGRTYNDIRCYQCQAFGHYANDCPRHSATPPVATTGTTLLQHAFVMAQHDHAIDPNWILLDSQSTISVFNNPNMLTNIRDSGRTLRALTNGGFQDSTQIGTFPNLGEVWYNPHSIANILSLADVCRVRRVTMDSDQHHALFVHRKDGSLMKFEAHPSGLYVFNANSSKDTVNAYTLVNTVADQKKLFTPRQIADANKARDLYRMIGRPSEADFQRILKHNFIHNCPVTPTDAARALAIYGKDVPFLKGRTTQRAAAPHVPKFTAVPLPPPVLQHHREVTLCADYFYVQKIPFFHTISRDIGFRTAHPVPDRHRDTTLAGLTDAIKLYSLRGFSVTSVHGDHEFECVRASLLPIVTDVVSPDCHVGEVERSIRTIKERLRACAHGLPYKRLPKLMIHHMVAHVLRCLNQFPWANGVSHTMSPDSLVTGSSPVDFNKLRLEFGSYVQLFEANNPTNTPKARSLGAIALTPTGNANGDYYFLSLATGACLSRHQWTTLPIPDTAIARVEALALHEGQPLLQDSGLVVEWRPDMAIDDDEYDRDYAPPDLLPVDEFSDEDYDPLDPTELDDLGAQFGFPAGPDPPDNPGAAQHQNEPEHPEPEQEPEQEQEQEQLLLPEITDEEDANEPFPDEFAPPEGGAPQEEDEEEPHELGAPEPEAPDAGGALPEGGAPIPETHPGYNLRERRFRTDRLRDAMDHPHGSQAYHGPVQLLQTDQDSHFKFIFEWVMTQMTAKAGLEKHGEFAETALLKEFSQHQDLDVWEILDPATLTYEQRKGALRAINLIKEKRNGDLKGRTVADGSKQRGMYPKSETASPTVSTVALLLTILVDAYEGRDVATCDVAGAYLKASMKDFVIIKFTGKSVDIIVKMNPSHAKFVTYEKGVKTLYARLKKALYGCVQSALLWYKLFHDTLQNMGFTINPYDPCVANCMINGSQCTIAWYVDDMKISHIDPNVVTEMIEKLESHFDKMTVTRGKEHCFLGMDITYNENRTAEIKMESHLQKAMDDFHGDVKNEAVTPHKKNLFEVDEHSESLAKEDADNFRSVTASLLYVATRARVDILLPVGFLATRVTKCTVEDQGKLQRVLEFVKKTLHDPYILGADNLTQVRTWVDASFAVHPDMKSHTGGMISYGRGGLACKSTKQKVNMKSSTHAELVGVSEYLATTIWITKFMKEQGYPPLENTLEQDNESAIKLEANGRTSAGAKSRHLDIQYFWIKENLETMGIKVRHCRTLKMIADFFTKPLQGALFKLFRDIIMGHKLISSLDDHDLALLAEERVEEFRPVGRVTDDKTDIDEDGFILVKRKEKNTRKYVAGYGAANGAAVKKSDKIVSWSLP